MNKYELVRDKTMSMDMEACYGSKWDWPQGVALYGLLRGWTYLKDEKAFAFIRDWSGEFLDIPKEEYFCVNCVAPMIVFSELYKQSGDERYQPRCEAYLDWIFNRAPRLACGALQHTVLQDFYFPGQAWIDTTFMVCLFLNTMYEITGDERCAEEALRQLRLHHRILKDKKTGLLCHGYDENTDTCPGGANWGRGNGWLSVASVEVLSRLKNFNSDYDYVKAMLFEQMEGLEKYQRETGMWHTLIDWDISYDESSGTACFAYAMLAGVKSGILPEKYWDIGLKAYRAIEGKIKADGTVADVSGGTGLCDITQLYNTVSHEEIMPWGQGIALALTAFAGASGI